MVVVVNEPTAGKSLCERLPQRLTLGVEGRGRTEKSEVCKLLWMWSLEGMAELERWAATEMAEPWCPW